jgi:hypothetical protein
MTAAQDQPDFDPEGPDPEEMDDHDQPDVIPCPHCRKMVYEDAETCQHCGQDLDNPPLSSPWSMVMVLIICALLAIFAGAALFVMWR